MKKYNLELMNENEVNGLLLEKINECRGLINSFIYKHQKYDRGDVENCCYEGIFKAIINYDEEKNSSFKPYARLWIQSELAYFRASELSIFENKEAHRKRMKVLRYIDEYRSTDASDEDLKRMKISREEFNNYRYSYSVLSLDRGINADGLTLADVVAGEDSKQLHLFEYLKNLVDGGRLAYEDYKLLSNIYLDNRSENELSKSLNIKRQSVNKRKQKALNKLNLILKSEFGSLNEARSALTY